MKQSFTRIPFGPLPGALTVGGEEYPVDTDFRPALRVREMWCDERLCDDRCSDSSRAVLTAWKLTFRALLGGDAAEKFLRDPALLEEAAGAVLWYLCDGRVTTSRPFGEEGNLGEPARLISYSCDEGELTAAFRSVYGIDLYREQMHLWLFDRLLSCLPEDCRLSRIVHIRAADISDIPDEGERARAAALKAYYAVPKLRRGGDSVGV